MILSLTLVSFTETIIAQIADKERKISYLYDMLDYQDTTNVDQKGLPLTIRTVFIIDPKKVIRLTISYPAVIGRNFVCIDLRSSFSQLTFSG